MSNELTNEVQQQSLITSLVNGSNEVIAIENKIALLKAQLKKVQETNNNLTQTAIDFMLTSGLKTIVTRDYKVTLKEPSTVRVIVDDEKLLPESFIRTKVIKEPNKEKIKVALKDGEEVAGTHLEKSEPSLLITELDPSK